MQLVGYLQTLLQPPCVLWLLTIFLLGAVLWYLLYYYVSSNKAGQIQGDIANRTSAGLATQASLVNVSSMADGRDVMLTGVASSAEARQRAEQIVLNTRGVRQVRNEIEIRKYEQATEPSAPKYTLVSSAKIESMPDEFPPLKVENNQAQEASNELEAAQQKIDELEQRSISFLRGSATLTEQASIALNELAQTLKKHPNIRLRVEGHTDNTGVPAYNLELSGKRAQSVVDFLGNLGIDTSRLAAKGFGDNQPIASNDTQYGRSKNRRIEFKLINGEE